MEKEAGRSRTRCWIDRELGRGSFGNVYLLTCSQSSKRTHLKYALKVIKEHGVQAQDREAAHKELRIMRGLYHPNVVTLIDSYHVYHHLLLVLELCEGGDLRNFLDNVKRKMGPDSRRMMGVEESLAVKWTLQLTSGLQYLHHKKILHRDLKPQNIFLKDKLNIKIGDLGIARQLVFTKEMANTHIGTPLYISPEIYQGKSYSYKTDVWSLGCCVYEMMTLQYAFHASSKYELVGKVVNKEVLPLPQCYTCSLRNLVLCMLCKDPDDRPHAKQLLASLQELNSEPSQPHWRRGEAGETDQDRSQRPQDPRCLQDWRLDMARALRQFLNKKQAMQNAQLNAALAQNLSASSIRDIDDSSGEDSSHSAASRMRGRISSKSATSETASGEDVDGATLCHRSDVALSSEDTQNSSSESRTLCVPQSHAEARGGRSMNNSRFQSGHPRQVRWHRKDKSLDMCDSGDDGSSIVESDCDSDSSALKTPLPGVRSKPSRLKIGKLSMVIRTRPLPQPRLHTQHAHSDENFFEHQSTSATAIACEAASLLMPENSAIRRVTSSPDPLVNPSRPHQSEINSQQLSNNKEVDMAYANEVLQWARDKLLPSEPQTLMANGCHDNSRHASSDEADGTCRAKTSSGTQGALTNQGLRDVTTDTGTVVQDKVKNKEVGGKYVMMKKTGERNMIKKGTSVTDMETERGTGASVDADTTGQRASSLSGSSICAPPKPFNYNLIHKNQEKGKKKKRNFLRERKVKQVEGRTTEDAKVADTLTSKVVKEADKPSAEKPSKHGVTLYTRVQQVSFVNLKADEMDLSIGNESYI